MRVLVAITCLAVLAAIGYFFWSEHQAVQGREAAAEFQRRREVCLTTLDQDTLTYCLADGIYTEAELRAARGLD